MDTVRGHDSIEDQVHLDDRYDDAAIEAPPGIGSDERRMHVRAYNYWASLLGVRNFPSIEDLNPAELEDFASHSVLLDFTAGIENPAVAYLGAALRAECGIEGQIGHIDDVPSRSLLSRLTDHYLQIIANCAPIGFEAEFTNQRGSDIMYRGILMPFSSDDDSIDFVYGVINWKEVAGDSLSTALAQEVSEALRTAPAPVPAVPIWADGPSHGDITERQGERQPRRPVLAHHDDDETLDLGAFAAEEALALDADAGLYDRLAVAREGAEQARGVEGRSHAALYRAIGLAHDFALAAAQDADDYTDMLADAGIKAQARSPMTAVAKLIFGVDHDKTRLTEYALVLDHALASGIATGTLAQWLGVQAGGLKGVVTAIRADRRRDLPPKADPVVAAKVKLAGAAPIVDAPLGMEAGTLSVVVTRREADGSIAIVGHLDDARLAEKVLVRTAG